MDKRAERAYALYTTPGDNGKFRSYRDIAKLLGVSYQTVADDLKRFTMPTIDPDLISYRDAYSVLYPGQDYDAKAMVFMNRLVVTAGLKVTIVAAKRGKLRLSKAAILALRDSVPLRAAVKN